VLDFIGFKSQKGNKLKISPLAREIQNIGHGAEELFLKRPAKNFPK
jgi:hypothetical protein